MRVSLIAGFFYFLIVGAAGVFFGALREMFVSPVIGHGLAVVFELPIMLYIAWFSCQLLVKWCAVPHKILPRLVMGLAAFTLLMAMEQSLSFALQKLVVAQAPQPWTIIDYVGLAGQVAFGLMPLFALFKHAIAKSPDSGELFHKVPFPQRRPH
jgi:hypothetical protein